MRGSFFWNATDRWCFAGVFAVHLVAVLVALAAGITINPDPARSGWDTYSQTFDTSLLQTRLLETIWYSHAQPPLFNVYAGLLIKAFGPNFLHALYGTYILLGLGCVGLMALLIRDLTQRRRYPFAVALIFGALNPVLIVYEAWMLYAIPVAFGVLLAVYAVARQRWVVLMIVVNGLILTRSLFHPLILIPLLAFVVSQAQDRRRVLALSLLVSLPTGLWCTKNGVQYGVLGTSSWSGFGLWNIAAQGYSPDERDRLAAQGVIDAAVTVVWGSTPPPERLTRTGDIPSLTQEDYHNARIPTLARLFGDNAIRLIRHDPVRYLETFRNGVDLYTASSLGYFHVSANAARVPFAVRLATELYVKPLIVVLIAAAVMAWLRRDVTLAFAVAVVVYHLVVCNGAEFGENNRFKVDIELLYVVIVAAFAAPSPRKRAQHHILHRDSG